VIAWLVLDDDDDDDDMICCRLFCPRASSTTFLYTVFEIAFSSRLQIMHQFLGLRLMFIFVALVILESFN